MTNKSKITLDMWMTRDEKPIDDLVIGMHKPRRLVTAWGNFGDNIMLPHSAFKQITWNNEPVKVKVTIEIVKQSDDEDIQR